MGNHILRGRLKQVPRGLGSDVCDYVTKFSHVQTKFRGLACSSLILWGVEL